MATKKRIKMDRYLISKQVWEIQYIRHIFYRDNGEVIEHPSTKGVLNVLAKCGRSRSKVYKEFGTLGYSRINVRA